jgi:hypothetical protein
MATGRQLWEGAQFAEHCGAKSASLLRFMALGQMLNDAEDAVIGGRVDAGIGCLRELQAHCEKYIALLAPTGKGGPKGLAA